MDVRGVAHCAEVGIATHEQPAQTVVNGKILYPDHVGYLSGIPHVLAVITKEVPSLSYVMERTDNVNFKEMSAQLTAGHTGHSALV